MYVLRGEKNHDNKQIDRTFMENYMWAAADIHCVHVHIHVAPALGKCFVHAQYTVLLCITCTCTHTNNHHDNDVV